MPNLHLTHLPLVTNGTDQAFPFKEFQGSNYLGMTLWINIAGFLYNRGSGLRSITQGLINSAVELRFFQVFGILWEVIFCPSEASVIPHYFFVSHHPTQNIVTRHSPTACIFPHLKQYLCLSYALSLRRLDYTKYFSYKDSLSFGS